ncbi:hypothetical protein AB0F93_00580 [Micromonospora tulbaghiae]|uniref:hypothetical protein n=1 Tax=Micromonospora tulbaghiae TaxID=479978 RepID=UPI0033291789
MPEADRPSWRELLAHAQQLLSGSDARVEVTHAHGTPWHVLAPPQRLLHRCQPQSWGSLGPFQLVERCVCGATRIDSEDGWLGRNLRWQFARVGGRPPRRENPGDTSPLVLELRDALREITNRGEHG